MKMTENRLQIQTPAWRAAAARWLLSGLLLTCALSWVAVASSAPSGGDYAITRSTVDGGGGSSVGGDFVLTGTIGQPDARRVGAHGGDYGLAGGFWARAADVLELIFKDSFESP
jgi:hypothetical protein